MIRLDATFRFRLVKKLFVNFELDYKYNSDPAPERRNDDIDLISGLNYNFEF